MAHGLLPDQPQSHQASQHDAAAVVQSGVDAGADTHGLPATAHDIPAAASAPSPSQVRLSGPEPACQHEQSAACPDAGHRLPLSPAPNRLRPSDSIRMTLTGDSGRQAPSGARYSQHSRPAIVRTASSDATPPRMRRSPLTASTPPSPSPPNPPTPSRFPFLSSSVSAALKSLTSGPAAGLQDDELLNLDLEAALFPSGPPADGDAFSPAAFKNLQLNAAGLLRKFQAAYQRRDMAFQELRAEREAQDEEKSQVETRTRHFKMQLEEMAQKAAENEAMIGDLMQQLRDEKRLRMEDRRPGGKRHVSSNLSMASEDLAAEEDQRRSARRSSGATNKWDTSSDTDEESVEAASVFSRCRSPTSTLYTLEAAPMTDMPPPTPPPPPLPVKPAVLGPPRVPKQSQPQMSTIQKLFKGMSSDTTPKSDDARGPLSCRNCQGQDASVAWDTASLLRIENRGLKQRVGELEEAVEEALDAVNGIRL